MFLVSVVLYVWFIDFLIIMIVGNENLVIVVVVVIVLLSSLLVGSMCDMSLVCFVLIVFMKCVVRYMFIVFVFDIVCGKCCVLFVFGMMFSLIFG